MAAVIPLINYKLLTVVITEWWNSDHSIKTQQLPCCTFPQFACSNYWRMQTTTREW